MVFISGHLVYQASLGSKQLPSSCCRDFCSCLSLAHYQNASFPFLCSLSLGHTISAFDDGADSGPQMTSGPAGEGQGQMAQQGLAGPSRFFFWIDS